MQLFSGILKKRDIKRVPAGQHGGGEFAKSSTTGSATASETGNISPHPDYVIKPLSELDKKIIDFKPDRSLSDTKAIRPIEQVIPNAKFVPYSEVPFFDALNKLIGVDPRTESIEKYAKARAKFLSKLPVKKIPLDSIVVTQQMVNKDKVAKLVAQDDPSSKPIAAVRYKGKSYIMDGHHRTVAAVLRGDASVEGHMLGWVIDLDKKKYRHKFSDILKSAGNPNHGVHGWFSESPLSASDISEALKDYGLERHDKPELREQWLKHMPRVHPKEFFESLFGKVCANKRNLGYNVSRLHFEGDSLLFSAEDALVHGAKAPEYTRDFNFGGSPPNVYHAILRLDSDTQGKGAVKKLFKACLPLYRKMGMKEIHTTPGLDGGAYTWAKYGFKYASDYEAKNHALTISDKLRGELGYNGKLHSENPELPEGVRQEVKLLETLLKTPNAHTGWAIADMKTPNLDAHFADTIKTKIPRNPSTSKWLMTWTHYKAVLPLTDPKAMLRTAKYITSE